MDRSQLSWIRAIEEHARRDSDKVAVVYGEEHASYGELNRAANRLARVLLGNGLGPESIVPLFAERSIRFLIGLLAVLKSGCGYLPLDITYPPARLAHILSIASARLVLCDAGRKATVLSIARQAGLSDLRATALDDDTSLPVDSSNLDALPLPTQLAYVIFTSGSTGLPKGAMVEHGGMANHLVSKLTLLKPSALDRVVQNAPHSFDISVWQFICPLIAGAETHIVPDEIARDPLRLFAYVERRGVTVLEAVPSLIKAAIDELDTPNAGRWNLSALRCLMLTGETLPPAICERWFRAYPAIPIVNAYGPTECSDDVTHYTFSQSQTGALRIPIGSAIDAVTLHVVEEDKVPLRLVPQGAAGELCVSGIAVGRGYLRDPHKTACAFMVDPFSGRHGGRLYRTGDLVRQRDDGVYEHLGRIDRQVKVHGRRIELEEIEHVLRRYPVIKDVVVLAQSSPNLLVAYAVVAQPLDPDRVRAFAAQSLPAAMVPQRFIELPAFPLTANGKLDVRALQALQLPVETAHRLPDNPLECTLCQIWREVLYVERVSVDASFFELGGTSLSALKVLRRIHKALGVELEIEDLFNAPTARQMSRVVAQRVS